MTILQDIYYRYKRSYEIHDIIIQYFVNHIHKLNSPKDRWSQFNKYMTNDFICSDVKQELITIYGKYVNTILHIYKWLGRFRKKRAKIYNQTDLYGSCIHDFPLSDIVCIYENNTKYFFTIHDLTSLFYHALTHNIDNTMFITPIHPKNPHTNLLFSKSSLLVIKEAFNTRGVFYLPRVIYSYFKYNYNLDMVYEDNRYYLDMFSIETFIKLYITKLKKCLKLLKIIFLFCGYRLNESTCRRYIIFKHPDHNVCNNKKICIDEKFQDKLIENGNTILRIYYYHIFYNNNIDRYKINVLKERIMKYIPISTYFESVSYTFKIRQKQVIDKKFLDYIAVYYMNPFLKNGRERRRHLANIRMCIRFELDWNAVEIHRIDDEGQEDDSSDSDVTSV